MSNIVGVASYASGEQQIFTDSKQFIKTVEEELPYRNTSGFTYQVMTDDAATRKAVDDLLYNEYGEENPHDLAYYQNTGERQKKAVLLQSPSPLNNVLQEVEKLEKTTHESKPLTPKKRGMRR